jgi:signal transduction histidine kinase
MLENILPENGSLNIPGPGVKIQADPNETWLQLALDSAQMCAYKWDLKTGKIVRSNRSAPGAMVDTSRNSWIYSEELPIIHPEDRGLVSERIKEAIAMHRDFNIEYRVMSENGSVRWLQGKGHAVYDRDGKAAEVLSVTQDITQKKEDEIKLRNKTAELELTKEQLKLTLEAAGMVALPGRRLWEKIKSPELCRFLEIEDENTELDRDFLRNLMHPDDKKHTVDVFDEARVRGGPVVAEYRQFLPNGKLRWVMAKGAYVVNKQGGSGYFILQDITQRKNSEEQVKQKSHELSQVNQKLERFSAVVAHDLKGPLNTIAMAADLITGADSIIEIKESAEFIKSGVSRMATLISDLLEFAKSENNASLSKETVSLLDIVETVKLNLHAAIAETLADIEAGPLLPNVSGYPTQLLQLFQNLVSNALKFRSSRAPKLILNVKESGDHWLVTLKDNGLGIDLAKSPKMFEPFQRFHADKAEGTGLGLSICKKIVEMHGGKIWVDSEPGIGTQFSFTLSKN